jgi:predicted GNAT family acetyltransferase
MELREFDDAKRFLDAASPLLAADEPRHNLILGICATLLEAPDAYESVRAWTVEDDGAVVGAALRTPPFNIVVARPRDSAALGFLARELHVREVDLPGVSGVLPEVDEFAAAWEQATRLVRRTRLRLGIYQARASRMPDGVPGRMRLATVDDRQLLLDWWHAFEAESLPPDAPRGNVAANVDRRLASAQSGIVLWEDERPVCVAGFGGRTPNGVRIGPVYTPPELRRRGYASALVARLTKHLLDGGTRFCFLYTDLGNPTSNRIYQQVGYEFVAESADYAFER